MWNDVEWKVEEKEAVSVQTPVAWGIRKRGSSLWAVAAVHLLMQVKSFEILPPCSSVHRGKGLLTPCSSGPQGLQELLKWKAATKEHRRINVWGTYNSEKSICRSLRESYSTVCLLSDIHIENSWKACLEKIPMEGLINILFTPKERYGSSNE